MEIFGLNITRRPRVESVAVVARAAQNLQSVWSQTYWPNLPGYGWGFIEGNSGDWQRNVVTPDSQQNLLAFSAVFACVTGIASDVAKMRIKLDEDQNGIWEEITSGLPWLPVLRKPNRYQTLIEFVQQWIVSKLLYGNAYILKERKDKRGIVTAMYVLHPNRVKVLVARDGSVWYDLSPDYLSGIDDDDAVFKEPVPASEIIHDKMVALWHPLVGVSPIYACGVSATMGNKIQANSTTFFGNLSRPGGMLTAPGHIPDDAALRLKAYWEANFGGANVGRIAVGGDGLTFEPFTMPATDSQLIEQLKWTVEDVARAFHYPVWKLGGPLPPYSSGPEALTTMYYTDCLQALIESLERCLDEGLELPPNYGTELDLDNLMRMDTAALYASNNLGVGGAWMEPNRARFRANMKPVPGGDSPMIQQQNYSLAALAKRDAKEDPFATTPTPQPQPVQPDKETTVAREMTLEDLEFFEDEVRKGLALA